MSSTAPDRSQSLVHAFDKSGAVFKQFLIWTDKSPSIKKNSELAFVKCLVLQGSTAQVLKCIQIDPLDPEKKEFNVPINFAYNVNADIDPLSFHDVGVIPHTNDAAALDFIKQRFWKNHIYTETRPLLVSVNPYKDLGIATDKVILQYRDAPTVEELPPHVFSVARLALENMHSVHKSQTIIVSGESGAGKTEAVKQIMRYFAAARSGSIETHIQNAVLAANPVFEAFGNAKTIRNNNSSRFGRFVQLQVRAEGGIHHGRVSSFLLEKSRILTQDKNERSYHIFYQLLKGASNEEKQRFKLLSLDKYKFLNSSSTDADGIDDVEDWHTVKASLAAMKLSPDEINTVFSIISGVLLLGNVKISHGQKMGIPDAACLDGVNSKLLHDACSLLYLNPELVEQGILIKTSMAGQEKVTSCWKQSEAEVLKDSLAKGIYEKIFEYIIERLNSMIQPETEMPCFMALLDIFGFEVFDNNSLEQLLINITNELLQKNFIDAVFDRETKLYRQEQISDTSLVWTSNKDVVELLIGRNNSIMSVLEDQCLAPGGTDTKFVCSAFRTLKNSTKLIVPKVSPNSNFVIQHTIGNINYSSKNFLFKNKDVLRPELVDALRESYNSITASCFKNVKMTKGRLAKGQLIGSQFLNQLRELMEIIDRTESHFIRCVKPNDTKTPMKFVPSRVMAQFHSLSIFEALQLRNLGFAYRRPFVEFLQQYQFVNLDIANDNTVNTWERAKALLTFSNINPSLWRIGKTMVFMKPEATRKLTSLQREMLLSWAPIVETIEALVLKNRYRRHYDSILPILVRIQAQCRLKLCGIVQPPPFTADIKGWA